MKICASAGIIPSKRLMAVWALIEIKSLLRCDTKLLGLRVVEDNGVFVATCDSQSFHLNTAEMIYIQHYLPVGGIRHD